MSSLKDVRHHISFKTHKTCKSKYAIFINIDLFTSAKCLIVVAKDTFESRLKHSYNVRKSNCIGYVLINKNGKEKG